MNWTFSKPPPRPTANQRRHPKVVSFFVVEELGGGMMLNHLFCSLTVEDTPLPAATTNDLDNDKAIGQFRKDQRIRVYGTDVPGPFERFTDLASAPFTMSPKLLGNLTHHHYTTPTPIQMQAMPIILKGRDLMACAPTGSGKTLAYLLPILHDLKTHEKVGYRALIIAPTRELAQQVK